MSFSKHFRLSTKASQISTKKCSFLCFNSYQMNWEGSKMGQHLRQNVPFCYLTYTMALACFGICTTIVTIQRMCFKQPLCWGFCDVWHTSTNAQPSRQWLLFQASSSTCETSIWTMIKKVSSHAGRHMFLLMYVNLMWWHRAASSFIMTRLHDVSDHELYFFCKNQVQTSRMLSKV